MASWNDKNSSRVFVEGNFINVKNYSVYDSRLHIYQLQAGFLLTFLESWAALSAKMYTRQTTFDWTLSVSHSRFFYVIFPSQYTTISPFHTRNYEISLPPSLARWPRYNQKNAIEGHYHQVWSVPMTPQCGSSFVADHMGIFLTMQSSDFVHISRTLVAPLSWRPPAFRSVAYTSSRALSRHAM